MCAAIRQSVAIHTMKRRFGGSKQRMITTYDYLEAQLDDAELAKRILPAKKQRRGGRSATSAPAAPAVPSPAAGTRTTPRAACSDDMENDDAPVFATPGTRKRGRKAR